MLSLKPYTLTDTWLVYIVERIMERKKFKEQYYVERSKEYNNDIKIIRKQLIKGSTFLYLMKIPIKNVNLFYILNLQVVVKRTKY